MVCGLLTGIVPQRGEIGSRVLPCTPAPVLHKQRKNGRRSRPYNEVFPVRTVRTVPGSFLYKLFLVPPCTLLPPVPTRCVQRTGTCTLMSIHFTCMVYVQVRVSGFRLCIQAHTFATPLSA